MGIRNRHVEEQPPFVPNALLLTMKLLPVRQTVLNVSIVMVHTLPTLVPVRNGSKKKKCKVLRLNKISHSLKHVGLLQKEHQNTDVNGHISWNCRGFHNKLYQIKDFINKFHPVCIVFQETYFKPGDEEKIKRHSLVRRDCNSGRASGGVALLVSHDHPSSIIPLHTNLQAVAVLIAVPRLVTVCSLYLPPNAAIDRHDLDRLVTELPTPFIIIGDFNGHNPIWGSKNVNSRGRQIEEFISDHSLCLLNNGEHTHFHLGSRSFHCLDLAAGESASLAPFFTFRVGNDLCESDHFPIFLTRVKVPRVIPQRPERYIFDKADWASFTTRAKITWDMAQYPDLNVVIDNVTASILRAADETIPKSSTNFPSLEKRGGIDSVRKHTRINK
ncbi:hypothetical protein AVEN_101886-1 [Araneus ventricosus]|uniref:Endonuclease/exonuclease/phosphatase domain-containing protein n=1 Tax=Araneus ventricosus TaxID=182803 RepID=A0A4Y2DAB7_ARAVE|nr:hypothetical protein AVEN_101886-1 [Araneus ventricosus]